MNGIKFSGGEKFLVLAVIFLANALNIIFLVPTHPGIAAVLLAIGCFAGASVFNDGWAVNRSGLWWNLVWIVIFFGAYFWQRGEWK